MAHENEKIVTDYIKLMGFTRKVGRYFYNPKKRGIRFSLGEETIRVEVFIKFKKDDRAVWHTYKGASLDDILIIEGKIKGLSRPKYII